MVFFTRSISLLTAYQSRIGSQREVEASFSRLRLRREVITYDHSLHSTLLVTERGLKLNQCRLRVCVAGRSPQAKTGHSDGLVPCMAGYNSGRTYYFSAPEISLGESWISELKSTSRAASRRHDQKSRLNRMQLAVRRVYTSTVMQTVIAALILGNFVTSAFETQLNPVKHRDRFARLGCLALDSF